jgi:NACalpha-BTF3-like transcription factor
MQKAQNKENISEDDKKKVVKEVGRSEEEVKKQLQENKNLFEKA